MEADGIISIPPNSANIFLNPVFRFVLVGDWYSSGSLFSVLWFWVDEEKNRNEKENKKEVQGLQLQLTQKEHLAQKILHCHQIEAKIDL